MELCLPKSDYFESVEVITFKDDNLIYINAKRKNNKWAIESDLDCYDWFLYRINNQFIICDSHTEKSLIIKEGFCATIRKFKQKPDNKYILDTELCSELNEHNLPVKKTHYFTAYDPLVILFFNVRSESKTSFVITTEWISNNMLHWITSNHYELNKIKTSFNAMAVQPDTPSGNWTVNVFIDDNLHSKLHFVLDNKTKITPRSSLIDFKG